MNPPEEDLKSCLQKVEAEINTDLVIVPQSQKVVKSSQSGFLSLYYNFVQFVTFFNNLSGVQKLIVSSVGFLLGLAILQAVLKLVAAVISLALLAILVYVGYKFLVSNNSVNQQ